LVFIDEHRRTDSPNYKLKGDHSYKKDDRRNRLAKKANLPTSQEELSALPWLMRNFCQKNQAEKNIQYRRVQPMGQQGGKKHPRKAGANTATTTG